MGETSPLSETSLVGLLPMVELGGNRNAVIQVHYKAMLSSNSTASPQGKVHPLALIGLAVVVVLPWVILWVVVDRVTPRSDAAAPPVSATAVEPTPDYVSVGRWGTLEMNRVVIEPPDDLITVNASTIQSVVWHWPGFTPAELDSLLQRAGLQPDNLSQLSDRSTWEISEAGIRIRVPKATVVNLAPEPRRRLYAPLSRFEENHGQWAPATFRADSADDWFAHSELDEHTISLIRPLLYRRGNSLLLSDLELVLSDVRTMRQRIVLLRTLARSTAQFVKLRVYPESDVAAIAAYWAPGQRSREIEPLLKSVPHRPEGFTIDVIHLLPPNVRRLLNTYPRLPASGQRSIQDCHWTALNFSNTVRYEPFDDINEVRMAYQTRYHPVTDELRLGDVLLFVNSEQRVMHACVHIAGDLVYTKNGAWEGSPWILQRMEDVLDKYPSDAPLEIQQLRLKAPESG